MNISLYFVQTVPRFLVRWPLLVFTHFGFCLFARNLFVCPVVSPFCLHLCFLLSMFSFIWQLGMSCVFSGFTCFPCGQVSCCLKDGLCLHSDRHISVTFASSDAAVIFVFAFVCVFVFVIVLHHSDQVKWSLPFCALQEVLLTPWWGYGSSFENRF